MVIVALLALSGCKTTVSSPGEKYQGQSAEQIYNTAETYLADREYSNAVKAYEGLDSLYPFGPHAEQAQLDMIYAYYMSGDHASAAAAAERYIRIHPRSRHVDYAYYMKGLANFYQNRGWFQRYFPTDPAERDFGTMRQSFDDFAQLLRFYPQSRYAPDARQRMVYLRNIFARHELQVANYYLERRAYVAAANRANYIVQHYQSSTSTPEALAVMVKAYRGLGLTTSATEALRVLRLNYPQSKALKDAAS